jgi:hypothetical protein
MQVDGAEQRRRGEQRFFRRVAGAARRHRRPGHETNVAQSLSDCRRRLGRDHEIEAARRARRGVRVEGLRDRDCVHQAPGNASGIKFSTDPVDRPRLGLARGPGMGRSRAQRAARRRRKHIEPSARVQLDRQKREQPVAVRQEDDGAPIGFANRFELRGGENHGGDATEKSHDSRSPLRADRWRGPPARGEGRSGVEGKAVEHAFDLRDDVLGSRGPPDEKRRRLRCEIAEGIEGSPG